MPVSRRVLLAGAALPLASRAQSSYPDRPVRLIVPFPPGGPVDTLARLLAERLTSRWPQPVVVENRPGGGGGIVGTAMVAKAAPDGATIGMVISAHNINPAIRANMPYDTLNDFAAITQVARAPLVLVAWPGLPAHSVAEVVELAKRSEGGLLLASPGVGTLMFMAGHLLSASTGARFTDVPYQGSAPALTDVMQGRVPLMFDIWHSVKAHVEAGRLRVLATAGPEPIPAAPQIPLMQATLPGFVVTSPMGLVAPAGTPPAIVQRIAESVRSVIQEPEMARRLGDFGLEPVGSSPEAYQGFIAAEITRWRRIVAERNIRVQE